MSPEDIRAAAGAHHELGPEYSDAVVASFLEKVDREIAARVEERLAVSTPRARPVEPDDRRTLLKGFAMGVASSVAVLLLVGGATPAVAWSRSPGTPACDLRASMRKHLAERRM